MNLYSAFGGCLRSDIVLPDLLPVRGQPPPIDWIFRVIPGPPPSVPLELLGEHDPDGGGTKLFRTDRGLRLQWADQFVFDILDQGTDIVWYRIDGAPDEYVRALLLGPVLALTHHLSGALCLHGSAVSVGPCGIGFLAGKYHGKSTLALALTLGGARHLSDDALLVDLEPDVRLRPGIPSVRLWNDSAALLGGNDVAGHVLDGVKMTLTDLPARLVCRTPVALSALYMLQPVVASESAPAAERVELSPAMAAAALSCHTKLPQALIGNAESVPNFLRSAALVRAVPVFELRVMRDFARLPEVVETILGWHGAAREASPRRDLTRV
jgi:hypothetical protein